MSQILSRMADFDLTPDQREVRRSVRAFAEGEVLPHVERYEREGRYPTELVQKLGPLGLLGPLVPERYGGSFSDVVTYGIVCEELARVDWVLASVVSVSNSLAAYAILKNGSDAQKEFWLRRIASGACLASACLTEPGGGTDLGNLATRAERVAGGYVLNGSKVFISHAAHAGVFFVVATLDRSKQHQGVTAFLVDPNTTKGIRVQDIPMRTLKRDNLAEVSFEDAFVPEEALLGTEGGGFPILGSSLDMGRFSVAARCVGQAQRALDLVLPYAMERHAFGKPIGEFQLIQQKITDMIRRVEQARLLVYRLGRMKDQGIERASLEASLAKLVASEAAVDNALDGIQIFGAYGLAEGYEIGRLLLEAKALTLGEGTSELHTKLIAEYALGIRRA
jgi:alkylation response protein AidB-like acyl-CoA dehydrogenase